MSDIKIFRSAGPVLNEIAGSAVPLERMLQTQFEGNMDALLGVRFLATEYVTTNGGRMDTLGLDENGYPVIIEYKRDRSENVINQGLFYLDWLMDHRGDFELLVRDKLGLKVAQTIEWSAPRLICIASDFNKYDVHAVKQMSRNITLISYRRFGDDLLMLNQLTEVSTSVSATRKPTETVQKPQTYKTTEEFLSDSSAGLSALYKDVETHLLGISDDVTFKKLKFYFAFRRIKNFACVEIRPTIGVVRVYLKVEPSADNLVEGFTKDMRNIGHFGTGDLEVTLKSYADLERAKPLIQQSYDAS